MSPQAEFGPGGGSIGRADSSTLVLDDPDRTVSRVHAQVLYRAGQYFIVDRGSNPLMCNGQPLGAGNEAHLANRDRLTIGSFELEVRDADSDANAVVAAPGVNMVGGQAMPSASADDPFAGLLDGLITEPAAAPVRPAPASAAKVASASQPSPISPMDFDFGGGHAQDPFADLLGPKSSPAAPKAAAMSDDFSDLGIRPGGAAPSIDALFGLGGGPSGGDPFAQSPLADPLMQPNTAGVSDPLMALKSVAKPTAATRSDHVSALRQAYVAPTGHASSAPTSLPLDDFSDLLGPGPATPVVAARPAILSRVEVALDSPPAPVPAAAPQAAVQPPVVPTKAATPVSGGQYSDAELLAAFLRGVNSNHQMPVALTPGLMERIGSMLRSATEGTLQLLLTRQEFKREVRAEVTMIGAQHNNPLKFSPTVEVALAHLLGPGVRGFMPAQEAMRDAFHDLRAHQFGVMVGLHAALEHVLSRFTPDVLEKRLTEKTTFDALFSAGRKAKLWDQFCALHASISQDAQ
jgi:FHA domain-containing protein